MLGSGSGPLAGCNQSLQSIPGAARCRIRRWRAPGTATSGRSAGRRQTAPARRECATTVASPDRDRCADRDHDGQQGKRHGQMVFQFFAPLPELRSGDAGQDGGYEQRRRQEVQDGLLHRLLLCKSGRPLFRDVLTDAERFGLTPWGAQGAGRRIKRRAPPQGQVRFCALIMAIVRFSQAVAARRARRARRRAATAPGKVSDCTFGRLCQDSGYRCVILSRPAG